MVDLSMFKREVNQERQARAKARLAKPHKVLLTLFLVISASVIQLSLTATCLLAANVLVYCQTMQRDNEVHGCS
jgi:hypothetical protein